MNRFLAAIMGLVGGVPGLVGGVPGGLESLGLTKELKGPIPQDLEFDTDGNPIRIPSAVELGTAIHHSLEEQTLMRTYDRLEHLDLTLDVDGNPILIKLSAAELAGTLGIEVPDHLKPILEALELDEHGNPKLIMVHPRARCIPDTMIMSRQRFDYLNRLIDSCTDWRAPKDGVKAHRRRCARRAESRRRMLRTQGRI